MFAIKHFVLRWYQFCAIMALRFLLRFFFHVFISELKEVWIVCNYHRTFSIQLKSTHFLQTPGKDRYCNHPDHPTSTTEEPKAKLFKFNFVIFHKAEICTCFHHTLNTYRYPWKGSWEKVLLICRLTLLGTQNTNEHIKGLWFQKHVSRPCTSNYYTQ